jgi:hypothetical protein
VKRSYLLFFNEIGLFQAFSQAENWVSSGIYPRASLDENALSPYFPRIYELKLF